MDSTFELEYEAILHLCLYRQVKNIRELREKVVKGQLDCTLINPKLILDPFQIVVAANKAVVRQNHNELLTKSVCTEILFNLSISKNITESLKTFGIDDKCDNLILAYVENLRGVNDVKNDIDGEQVSLDELNNYNDENEIRKYYGGTKTNSLIDIIVTRIATKQ